MLVELDMETVALYFSRVVFVAAEFLQFLGVVLERPYRSGMIAKDCDGMIVRDGQIN